MKINLKEHLSLTEKRKMCIRDRQRPGACLHRRTKGKRKEKSLTEEMICWRKRDADRIQPVSYTHLAKEFGKRGIPSAAVYSNADGEFSMDRAEAIEKMCIRDSRKRCESLQK